MGRGRRHPVNASALDTLLAEPFSTTRPTWLDDTAELARYTELPPGSERDALMSRLVLRNTDSSQLWNDRLMGGRRAGELVPISGEVLMRSPPGKWHDVRIFARRLDGEVSYGAYHGETLFDDPQSWNTSSWSVPDQHFADLPAAVQAANSKLDELRRERRAENFGSQASHAVEQVREYLQELAQMQLPSTR